MINFGDLVLVRSNKEYRTLTAPTNFLPEPDEMVMRQTHAAGEKLLVGLRRRSRAGHRRPLHR